MTLSKIMTTMPLVAAIVVGIASTGELAASWQKATAWVPVRASVAGNGIGMTMSSSATAFIPEYQFEYRFGNASYHSQMPMGTRSTDPAAILAQLAAHPVGSQQEVFVNPGKPVEIAVNAGFNKETFEPALGGIACAAVFLAVYAGFRLLLPQVL